MAVNGGATEPGKIFVGGLSWDTDKDKLKTHFEQYGEVEESVVMMDSQTGKHRGFGFVTFKNPQSVNQALHSGPHLLDGKTVDPKPATVKGHTPRPQQHQPMQQPQHKVPVTRKIFVGGLPAEACEEDLKHYFTSYGPVESVEVKKDPNTQRSRGFGFVSFKEVGAVEKAVMVHFHQVKGKTVEAKKAEEPHQGGGVQGQQVLGQQQQAYLTAASYTGNNNSAAAAAAAAAAYYNNPQVYQQQYSQYPPGYPYYGQWPGQQSAVSSTGYSAPDSHAMYSQTAGAESYGGRQASGYSYDNSGGSQPASAGSYSQQTYGDTAATSYSYSSAPQQQQQRGGYYNS